MSISNFSCFMGKFATAEKKLTRLYIEAWSVFTLLAPKCYNIDIMIKRHMDINADLSESPLLVYQSRKQKQWRLISIYICKMWSVKYFPDYFAKIKKLLIKSICPLLTRPWLKAKWHTPKWNAAKYYIICIFHNVRPVCQQHRNQLGRG